MNKHIKKLGPYVDKYPRTMALLLSPLFIILVLLTVFISYPICVLLDGLANYRETWEDLTGPAIEALSAWSYCLIKGERGEW